RDHADAHSAVRARQEIMGGLARPDQRGRLTRIVTRREELAPQGDLVDTCQLIVGGERSLLVLEQDDRPEAGQLQRPDRAELAFNGGASPAADETRFGPPGTRHAPLSEGRVAVAPELEKPLALLALTSANLAIRGQHHSKSNPSRGREDAKSAQQPGER